MLQKSSIDRVLAVFCKEPTKQHYLMEISRAANLAHTSVMQNIKALLKEGLITGTIERKQSRKFPVFKANSLGENFRKHKKIHNLKVLFESGIIEFLEEKLTPKCIALFGSYQRGEDDENSDIDFFVECKEESIKLDVFEKNLGRKIQLHFKEKFTDYPKELKNNIINGIVLSGFLEGYK